MSGLGAYICIVVSIVTSASQTHLRCPQISWWYMKPVCDDAAGGGAAAAAAAGGAAAAAAAAGKVWVVVHHLQPFCKQ